MIKINKDKAKKLLRQARGLFPSRIPQGITEFNEWSESIISTYDLPTDHKDSIRFTLASALLQLGPQTSHKSKLYFVLTMKAAAAKQVASSVFYEIKTKQQEEATRKSQENKDGLEQQGV